MSSRARGRPTHSREESDWQIGFDVVSNGGRIRIARHIRMYMNSRFDIPCAPRKLRVRTLRAVSLYNTFVAAIRLGLSNLRFIFKTSIIPESNINLPLML